MNLKQLRWLAILAPVVVVALLELARAATIGATSLQSRILLDGLVAMALVLMGAFMMRSVGRIQQRLERRNEELLALHGAGLDVSAELSLDVVLNKVVERARTLAGARYGALSVVNADGSIQTFITAGITSEERGRIGSPPVGHGLLGVVLHEGERLRLPDIGKDPRSYGFPSNHPVMHSLLAVPVTCKGPFVGNLYLARRKGAVSLRRAMRRRWSVLPCRPPSPSTTPTFIARWQIWRWRRSACTSPTRCTTVSPRFSGT